MTDFLSGFVVTKSNTAMLQIVADGMKVQERAGNVREDNAFLINQTCTYPLFNEHLRSLTQST